MSRITKYVVLGPLAICLLTVLVHAVSMLAFDSRIEYKRVSFQSDKVPADMHGYVIAFISDTHAMPAQALEGIVSELNKTAPDLLILGGDFSSSRGAVQRSMEILSQAVTTDGIYGVEGNHDDYRELFAAMQRYAIRPLSNSGVHVRQDFYLAGLEDLWNRRPDIENALCDAKTGDFVLVIAHNPDVTMLQNTSAVDLILCGHTHGGQITLFGAWAPALTMLEVITDYGQRFMSGWAESRDGVPVYVSNGAGTFAGVPRIFARPQVVLITMYSETGNSKS